MQHEATEVRRALADGEFIPYFQPLVTLRTGQPRGFELLARWNHPAKGLILPEHFIPAAEQKNWIGDLTVTLLKKGFSAVSRLPEPVFLAVNVSPIQLHNPALPEQIQQVAEAAGFPLHRLVVEVTESALTQDMDRVRVVAHDLKERGCRLALDDFGTGYSSLSHLQSLPFDELKVDRSFVSTMTYKRDSRKIVAAVVGLGQSLGLTTVAEGVETEEQAQMLLWLGCDLAQGWLYGKPVPAAELTSAASAPWRTVPYTLSTSMVGRVSRSTLDRLPSERLAQLQAVYDGSPVGLGFVDRNLRYVTLNQRLADMNGLPIEKHIGSTVPEIIPEFFASVEPYLRRALQGESIPGVELTKPPDGPNPGKIILLSYEPARDEGGEVVGVSVALMDITSFRQAEEARQESEEHFRHMMELSPQIPWIIDAEGRALDASRRWLDITGMNEDEWRGFGWFNALHPDDIEPTRAGLDACLKSGELIDLIYRIRRPGGPWKRMRARGAPRRNANGEILCWYGSLEEVEE